MKFMERLFNSGKKEAKKDDLGRNETCWCGSGKKYKRCHLEKDAHRQRIRSDMAKTRH